MQRFAKQLVPSRLETAYCAIIAALVSAYWLKERFLDWLASSGATPTQELHSALGQQVDGATNNNFFSFLSLAIFWALVGAVSLAFLYQVINWVVSVRNDYTIVTTYTKAKSFEQGLVKTILQRTAIIIGLIVFAMISWKLLGTWHDLIVQPAGTYFSLPNIAKELAGFLGLTVNIYLIWMWLVFSVSHFLAQFA